RHLSDRGIGALEPPMRTGDEEFLARSSGQGMNITPDYRSTTPFVRCRRNHGLKWIFERGSPSQRPWNRRARTSDANRRRGIPSAIKWARNEHNARLSVDDTFCSMPTESRTKVDLRTRFAISATVESARSNLRC